MQCFFLVPRQGDKISSLHAYPERYADDLHFSASDF